MQQPPENTATNETAEIARLKALAQRMDAIFRIPGTRIDVGLDSLLGLIPGIGDTAAALPSFYIIYRSYRLGASPGALAYMLLNATLDWTLGTIPILGDIFDAAYNANLRNVALLEKNLAKQAARARDLSPPAQSPLPPKE